jgi:hypothetical protein
MEGDSAPVVTLLADESNRVLGRVSLQDLPTPEIAQYEIAIGLPPVVSRV